MLKRFSQEKYEEGQKQEYLDRKQENGDDTREYNTDKRLLPETGIPRQETGKR